MAHSGQIGPIPTNGRSDRRPLIHGFTKYRDLFNDRQLLHLNLLGQAIVHAEEPQLRRLLAMAFSEHLTTNCMYTAYAFGYRRVSPMFSIHSYRHITRPVEINPWLDGIGRGTFPNVVGKIAKAVAFAKAPTELDPKGGRRLSTTSGIAPCLQGLFRSLDGTSRVIPCLDSDQEFGVPRPDSGRHCRSYPHRPTILSITSAIRSFPTSISLGISRSASRNLPTTTRVCLHHLRRILHRLTVLTSPS